MLKDLYQRISTRIHDVLMAVPVRVKITGIILLPVLILGFSLNYWVTTSLSDWLSYILVDTRVEAAMQAGSRSVMLVTVLAAAASILLAFTLTFLLTRPLLSLHDTAQKVAAGNLGARARVWAQDEIGQVAQSVNNMLDHLVATQNDLARTNVRLEAVNRIVMAAEREMEIHDVLYVIVQVLLDVLDLETGWVYLRDPECDRFHLATWHGVPQSLQPELLHRPGDARCACQMDLVEGKLGVEATVLPCKRLETLKLMGADVGDSHITIPLEARGQRFGVLNLICRNVHCEHSDEDFELLNTLGTQISEIVANAWLRLKLAEKEAARQALLESLVKAEEDERSRLSRDLHDGAGQTLTNLLVRLKTLEKQTGSDDLRDELTDMLDIVSGTIDQIRDLSYRLRPPALEEFGLALAIETLVEEMAEDAGIAHECKCHLDDTAIPSEIETVIYRIVQEGVTNVIRHAEASRVDVTLARMGNEVAVFIDDDGVGFEPDSVFAATQQHRLGLLSMQERTEMLGGTFNVDSTPGGGASIRAQIPLPEGIGEPLVPQVEAAAVRDAGEPRSI